MSKFRLLFLFCLVSGANAAGDPTPSPEAITAAKEALKGDGGSHTCHFLINGKVVQTTITRDRAECKKWTDALATKLGLVEDSTQPPAPEKK